MIGCEECENARVCRESGLSEQEISTLLVAMDIFRSPAAVREISGMDEAMDEKRFLEAYRKLEPIMESCPYVRLSCDLFCEMFPLDEEAELYASA